MVKYHFITFATPDHISFAQANVKTAIEVGGFDTAKICSMDDIDDNYKKQNSHFFNSKRPDAYFIWKPYIILKQLLDLDEGDILCYNDSKYLWLKNVRVLENDILKDKNIGVYHNKPNDGTYIEKQWTKNDAFFLMNIPNSKTKFGNFVRNSPQAWAGFILLRKSFDVTRFISEWLTYVQDYRISSDSTNIIGKNDPIFMENRHDQSVLSLLFKKWSIPMHFIDKTYMIDVRNLVH